MKWLDSRDLGQKTWQGFEMGGSEGEESIRGESQACVPLRRSLRQGILEEEEQFGGGEDQSSLWVC